MKQYKSTEALGRAMEDIQVSINDTPYSVKPMTSEDRQIEIMRSMWTSQKYEDEESGDSEIYIWRQADKLFKEWLKSNGYYVIESQVFDDCIGYNCSFNNHNYTVYMYAYGKGENNIITGEYCAKLDERDFTKGFVLIVNLMVERSIVEGKARYSIYTSKDADNRRIELLHPHKLDGKNILLFFPQEDMFEIMEKLIYAVNNESLDALSCIISKNSPVYKEYGGNYYNDAFYYSMVRIHREHGDMALGYVTYNGIVYSMAPYIDNFGWFDFSVDNKRKICIINNHSFYEEGAIFVKSDEEISCDTFEGIPVLVSVETFPAVLSERFALKAFFDNGEVIKYVLPISREDEEEEVISYCRHVFTDGIWKSAFVNNTPEAWYRGFNDCLPCVCFKNGFLISGMQIYEDGVIYSEPVSCEEVVYEDEEICVRKVWTWDAVNMYQDEETNTLDVLLRGEAFNCNRISTIASIDGKRVCSLDFVHLGSTQEGLRKVGVRERGYGFINSEGQFAIPPVYEKANDFDEGYAAVKKKGQWIFIDKNGREISIGSKYQDIGHFSEEMCRVSTLKLSSMDLAYYSDYAEIAGIWGYVNEDGYQIIPPQYIYAEDFNNGIAIVCKGEWTKDPKWDNEYNKGRYWTEQELWGGIDKNGNEVIPFIFDELQFMWEDNEVLMAHIGGWECGHWGVIDRTGKWLAEPVFEDIGYVYANGLFAFYNRDRYEPDALIGIFDINQNKVIFEPQFLDVDFMDDGDLKVKLFDRTLNRAVEKIIDLDGKERFHSEYTTISTYRYEDEWEVTSEVDGVSKSGLIDHDGNVIFPCKYDIEWGGISSKSKRIVVNSGDKVSLLDFDGNVIIPAKYDKISGMDKPLYTVSNSIDEYRDLAGLVTPDGIEVLPPEFEHISFCKGNYIICVDKAGCAMLKLVLKSDK
ncbi:MAG: WG repeat-containing protein [Bacillota bacterium]|nr:WG repeat-containing protein [Bacillota bacterium]